MYFAIAAGILLVFIIIVKAQGYGLYYDIPPCPECGSSRTGRYLGRSMFDYENRKILQEAKECGELVKLTSDSEKKHTAFCRDCGHEWHFVANASFITSAQRAAQRELRYNEVEIENIGESFGDKFLDARKKMKGRPLLKRYMPFSDLTSEVFDRTRDRRTGRKSQYSSFEDETGAITGDVHPEEKEESGPCSPETYDAADVQEAEASGAASAEKNIKG